MSNPIDTKIISRLAEILDKNQLTGLKYEDESCKISLVREITGLKLLHDPRFLQVSDSRARTGDPHTDLAAGVPAQYGTVLHQNHLCAVPRRRDRGKHSADSAADHAKIGFMISRFQAFFHKNHPFRK